jgi:hypothetical protein
MPDPVHVSSAQASDLLRQIEATEQRTLETIGYREASGYLMIWGLVWASAFGASHFFPGSSGAVWLVALAAGTAASAWLGLRQAKNGAPSTNGRVWTTVALIFGFGIVASALLGMGPRQVSLFWVLMIMTIYMVMGTWLGSRFAVLGASIAALVCVVYFVAPDAFNLWMALLGGGGLLLGGFWLRWRP